MKQIKYIFLLSIIFFSCDEINTTNDFSNDFIFLCVLKNDQPIQKAYLYHAIDIKSYFELTSWFKLNDFFIHDAEIIISDGIISSQLQVREFPVSFSPYEYTYSDDSLFYGKILPNKKYDLQLKVNNEIITGSTITPGEFSINNLSDTIYPYPNTETGNDEYRISWTESNNSFQYLVFLNVTYKDNFGREIVEQISTINTVDTFAIVKFPSRTYIWVYGPNPFDETEGHLYSIEFIVVAVDKNYYDHTFLLRDRAGLSSQYGVFGSSITKSHIAYIKYND